MPEKRDVSVKVDFGNGKGSIQMHIPNVTTSESIDMLMKEVSFKKRPFKIGTIKKKEKKTKLSGTGFIQSGVE
jgi:hypothetical protein